MKCVLISFFHSSNLGDLFIAHTLAGALEQHCRVERLAYSREPRRLSDIDDLSATFSPVSVQVWRSLFHRLGHVVGLDAVLARLRGRGAMIPWRDDPDILQTIRGADLVVIGGGNMIFDTAPWTRSWEYFDVAVDAARDGGIPVVAMCLGIGPFSTNEQSVQAARSLSKCDEVSFRDAQSLELYRTHSDLDNGCLSVDPVFTIEGLTPASDRSGVIGINCVDTRLSGAGPRRVAKHRRGYLRLIEEVLCRVPNEIVLFSTDMNDYSLLEDLERRVGSSRCRVSRVNGQRDLFELYRNTAIIIAARMHVLITAYTQSIPIIGLSWQAKVDGFFQVIDDAGSKFELNGLSGHVSEVLAKLESKLGSLAQERETIAANLPGIKQQFEVNYEIVRSVFRSRGTST